MEVYANGLSHALRTQFAECCQVLEYRPHVPALLGQGNWRMRLSRFGLYPWQARRQQGQINHILDHGYGHLLYVLDPERTVVTVHDLIPLVRWRGGIPGLAPGSKPWLNLLSFNALRRARHLIADSENTRRDLVRFCKCAPDRISVVYPGIQSIFRPYSIKEKALAYQELNLSQEDGTRRVLMTGFNFYKNHVGGLRAFARLRKLYPAPIQLLKTGDPTPEWMRAVRELGIESVTRCLGVVPHSELPKVYNCIDLLLFPSLYEGFGWPPLEAMACGTPVVISNAGSLPEVVGESGLMYPAEDYRGFAEAMHAVLTNEGLRQSLVENGLVRARKFTWEETAQKTLTVYEQVV
jgi:glycosyltransferase involved in cell wall biosynthesis